ncbi:MAG: DUF2064 domain-containing protein [Pseudomonadales bacterium]|nr:DUF2064 domain-containing protein [Pseudomonadales bacterium]
MTDVLCLFTRTPSVGECKTRLIPLLGEAGACDAHVELVESQIARLSSTAADCSLWITSPSPLVKVWTDLLKARVEVQRGDDLGQRMHFTFVDEFNRGAARVCLIGGDCPGITASYVEQAFDGLNDHAIVLGPTEDGGYGLVALREPHLELFENIAWSTPEVLAETLRNAATRDLSVQLLDRIWDVDTPDDWHRFKAVS